MKNKLKYVRLFVAAAVAAGAPLSTKSQEVLPELEAVEIEPVAYQGVTLEAVENYLNGIETMRADFTQIAPNGVVSRGVFHLERPGRVRFEYQEDVPILIVSDGNILNFIDYEIGQITRWPVSDTPLAFLLDETFEFGANIEISGSGPGSLANIATVTTFDPKKPEQGTLTLIFERGENGADNLPVLTLRAWEVVDAQGTLTRIRLANSEVNIPLDDELWEFEDPRNERFQRRRKR